MFSADFIITANVVCIAIMVLMTAVLCAATRLRGGAALIALIIVLTTIPVYIYNMTRSVGMWDVARWAIYPCTIGNTMLMPLLWLFIKREFNSRVGAKSLIINAIPTIVMAAVAIPCFASLGSEGMNAFLEAETAGESPWIITINTSIVFGQAIVYFVLIFRRLRNYMRILSDNCSDAELLRKSWLKKLMVLYAILYGVVAVAYIAVPETDAWLIAVINTVALAYLVYNLIAFPTTIYIDKQTDAVGSSPQNELSEAEMEECCRKVTSFLRENESYKLADLNLHQLAEAVAIPPKTISRSINAHLGKNFFELINSMRIDEAKRLLKALDRESYNIDSIYTECGFRSRSTFFLAFRKAEGTSPARWLKEQ